MKYHLVVYKLVCGLVGIQPKALKPEPHGFVAAGGVMLLLHEKLDLHIERHLVSGPLPCVQCVLLQCVCVGSWRPGA
jgi:hypothetical protein